MLCRLATAPAAFGIAVGAGVWALRHPEVAARYDVNRPSVGEVTSCLFHVVFATLAFALLPLLVQRARPGAGAGPSGVGATLPGLLAPLLGLPFVVALRVPLVEAKRPLLTLLYVALVAACCARGAYAAHLTREAAAGSDDTAERRAVAVTLALLWAAYAYAFSRLSIAEHHALHTRTFDLGLYDNIFFQSSHGRPLGCSFLKGGTHASAHFDPILVLLSPLYFLHPRAELLLVLQSIWLGAGVVPVYLVARRRLESRAAGLAFAVVYLLHPALHGANLYEFHSLTLVVPLLAWMIHLLEVGASWVYAAVLALALSCREDVALLACFVGLYGLMDPRGRRVRAGWLTIALSLAYFLVVKACLMRSSDFLNDGPGSYGFSSYYQDLVPNDRGLRDVLLSVVTNPAFVVKHVVTEARVTFVLLVFMPLGFLPFVARPGRVMLLYGAVFCLLASDPALASVNFYYASVVFPLAFAIAPAGLRQALEGGAVATLGLDPRRARAAVLTFCVVSAGLVSWKFGALVENGAFRGPSGTIARRLSDEEAATHAWVEETVRRIPEDATLGVTMRMGPHASNRRAVTMYPFGPRQDFVLLHRGDLRPADLARLEEAVAAGELVEVARRGPIVLYRRP
jgi:uncharacterized membrane protein